MFTTSRRPSETLTIGDGPDAIRIVIVDIRGNRVTLGVQAPPASKIRVAGAEPRPTPTPPQGQLSLRKGDSTYH
jgi:hypothetical protein